MVTDSVVQMWWGNCGTVRRNRSAEQFFTFKRSDRFIWQKPNQNKQQQQTTNKTPTNKQTNKQTWNLRSKYCDSFADSQLRPVGKQLTFYVMGLGRLDGLLASLGELRVKVQHPSLCLQEHWVNCHKEELEIYMPWLLLGSKHPTAPPQHALTCCCYNLALGWGCGRENDLSYFSFLKKVHWGKQMIAKQSKNNSSSPQTNATVSIKSSCYPW